VSRRGVAALAVLLAAGAGCSREEAPDAPTRPSNEATAAPRSGPVPYTAVETVPDGVDVPGTVKITGPIPKLKPYPVTQDTPFCGSSSRLNRSLQLGPENGVANAVVEILGIGRGKRFVGTDAVLDQKGCAFEPYVQVIKRGVKLTLRNSDPVNHNVHAYAPSAPFDDGKSSNESLFNMGMPLQGQTFPQPLDESRWGPIRIKCDAHSWMFAWVYAASSPYAEVTDTSGRFTLAAVPPGTYTLRVWHELLGSKDVPLTVEPGVAPLSIELSVAGP